MKAVYYYSFSCREKGEDYLVIFSETIDEHNEDSGTWGRDDSYLSPSLCLSLSPSRIYRSLFFILLQKEIRLVLGNNSKTYSQIP